MVSTCCCTANLAWSSAMRAPCCSAICCACCWAKCLTQSASRVAKCTSRCVHPWSSMVHGMKFMFFLPSYSAWTNRTSNKICKSKPKEVSQLVAKVPTALHTVLKQSMNTTPTLLEPRNVNVSTCCSEATPVHESFFITWIFTKKLALAHCQLCCFCHFLQLSGFTFHFALVAACFSGLLLQLLGATLSLPEWR